MPRVLFLGICLDFHYFLGRVGFPKLCLNLSWRAIAETLVKPYLVPPIDPFKRRNLNVHHVCPRSSMNQFIFVGTIDVFSQGIVVGVVKSRVVV